MKKIEIRNENEVTKYTKLKFNEFSTKYMHLAKDKNTLSRGTFAVNSWIFETIKHSSYLGVKVNSEINAEEHKSN